jgi:hypothetical protein
VALNLATITAQAHTTANIRRYHKPKHLANHHWKSGMGANKVTEAEAGNFKHGHAPSYFFNFILVLYINIFPSLTLED